MTLAPHHIEAARAGARCAECPLHNCGAGPVPPAIPAAGPIPLLVVGEFPSPLEVDEGQTGIGPAAREIRTALKTAGADGAAFTNAMLCRPPGGDLEQYTREAKRAGHPSPLECCAPRLHGELARTQFAIYAGNAAVKAAGIADTVMRIRGMPVAEPVPGVPVLSPGFVFGDSGRLMRPVLHADIAKAVRIARGGSTWRELPYYVVPTAAELRTYLGQLADAEAIAVDTETDGVDPWTCGIRRIGIGTRDAVLIVAPLSVDGTRLLPLDVWQEMQRDLAAFFARPLPWVFHNFFGFDSILLTQHGMSVNETRLTDTLIGHHIGPTSEFPHRLDFLASVYTDAPAWKHWTKHEKVDT